MKNTSEILIMDALKSSTRKKTSVDKNKKKIIENVFTGNSNIKSSNPRSIVNVPVEMNKILSVVVNGRLSIKSISDKLDNADSLLKAHGRKWWIDEYVRSGQFPEMTTLTNGSESIDFLQTSNIDITKENVDALEAVGFPIKKHLVTTGVKIDMKVLEKHNLTQLAIKAITEALQNVDGITSEILSELFVSNVRVEPTFFKNFLPLVKDSLPSGSRTSTVIAKCEQVLEILSPTIALKNPDNNNLDRDATFELVYSETIPITEVKKKKRQ